LLLKGENLVNDISVFFRSGKRNKARKRHQKRNTRRKNLPLKRSRFVDVPFYCCYDNGIANAKIILTF